ncbi:MAG: hypothetical protein V3G42_14070 [Oscillospiraceae bacterium]
MNTIMNNAKLNSSQYVFEYQQFSFFQYQEESSTVLHQRRTSACSGHLIW